ncbi:plus-3-domain-containing protein [Trichocladium antarcticum]|uniref:Plus-3-domain-containing protein n=1 Tax=Trichocladium antarcticum TaxID=1450529 RepID=A0AAN6ZDG9_9PEZI|nr:plus-3-domain-containing protein [Trichocladium antarcticum]
MSDIDDELLALAGGDVSSDEEPMELSRDELRSPSPAPTPSKDNDTPARGSTGKRTPAKTTQRRGSRSDGESDEEGEASSPPASPGSQMSAPMDESDSDDDGPQNRARSADDDMNPYPVEGLFKSHEDKARIMSMREIEREQILAERREENERIRQNRMLRQLKVNQEKDSKKRKASAADLEDASRKPARRTKAGEVSDKMDTLRRAREERSSRKEQRERENDRRRQRSPSYRRSRSSDDRDSEHDWRSKSRQRSRTPEPKETPPADLRDVERIRLGRSRFAEVCFYPGFEKAITGCYVRINIGPDPSTRQEVYRMAVVKGFAQGRPYAIPDNSGHQMVVDLYVKAAHGKAQREWPFISCSDRHFTEAEWNRYKQVCLSEGLPIPTKPELVDKIDDINKLVKRSWTEQELSEKLKRQNALHTKYSGVERDQLTKQLGAARARGDEAAVARLQDRLENLETPRLAFRTSMGPQKKKLENKGPTQQEKLALLNAENRRRNAESVRKAQLKERIRISDVIGRGSSGRERTPNDNNNNSNNNNKAQASGASTPANGAGNSGNGTPKSGDGGGLARTLPHIAKLQEQQRSLARAGMPVIHKPLLDDDIIGALDLDIDVEID